jgi:aspartate-semialdehyde dehydrogenase
MSRRSASRATARVAVVGSGSAEGTLVRAALAERGVEGANVDFYGVTHGEAVLSEYDGEARLIQDPEPGEVRGHDVVFLCEPGDASASLLALAGGDSVVLDLVGCSDAAPLVHAVLRPPTASERTRPMRVPHSIAVVLAELLRPLHEAFGVEGATAVVLRPAADFGQEGIEELREQTVRLLRFERPPSRTFGRQLAFNVIPQHLVPGAAEDVERRIEIETGALLRIDDGALAIRLATVPVFHGHAMAVRVALRDEAGLEEVERAAAARSAGPRPVGKSAPGTPMEAAAGPGVSVSHVSRAGGSGFWLWVVAGEADAASARAAVDLAASLAEIA